jgi:hypothetical protein
MAVRNMQGVQTKEWFVRSNTAERLFEEEHYNLKNEIQKSYRNNGFSKTPPRQS